MSKKGPKPFKPSEHVPGAKMKHGTTHERAEINAALRKHVYGQRVKKIEFERELDSETTIARREPTDQFTVTVVLENNVVYMARILMNSFTVLSRGDALGHLDPDDPDYTPPKPTALA